MQLLGSPAGLGTQPIAEVHPGQLEIDVGHAAPAYPWKVTTVPPSA
jgi:hypothetical protein